MLYRISAVRLRVAALAGNGNENIFFIVSSMIIFVKY